MSLENLSANALAALYALPALPIFGAGWLSQIRADRCVRRLTDADAGVASDVALAAFLKEVDLTDVEVVKSENYMQNEYDAAQNKIFLSPDTLGRRDVASVALALRAGAQGVAERRAPEKPRRVRALHAAENITFWGAFSILAFGIMSSTLATTVLGYALVALVYSLWRVRTKILREIDDVALKFAQTNATIPQDTARLIEQALKAERVKF
ncbi:MAG: zinc metallopeptidase [Thermoguttaceae bacterium]|nr:zinc metallopeptidase [Thermoguttaceae bacterium]